MRQPAETQGGTDVLQRILNEIELSEADQQRDSSAEAMEQEGLTPQRVEKQFTQREAELDSLEREIDTVWGQVETIVSKIKDRQDEDDFTRNLRNNSVDKEDYERVEKAFFRLLEELVPKLAIVDRIEYATMVDLKALVDAQQFAQDGNFIIEQTKKMQEQYESSIQKLMELQEKVVLRQTEQVGRQVDQLERIEELQRDRDRLVERLLEAGVLSAADADEFQTQPVAASADQADPSDSEGVSEASEGEASTERVLSPAEQKLVERVHERPDITDGELAQILSMKKTRVTELREKLVAEGVLDPSVDEA